MAASIQPDIVLLDAQWPNRALLRAQLIDEGYEVVATDSWPTVRSYVAVLPKPRLVIVDLQGLTDSAQVIDELEKLMPPDRVLILTALGGIPVEQLRARGFQTLGRPAELRDVIKKVAALVPRAGLSTKAD